MFEIPKGARYLFIKAAYKYDFKMILSFLHQNIGLSYEQLARCIRKELPKVDLSNPFARKMALFFLLRFLLRIEIFDEFELWAAEQGDGKAWNDDAVAEMGYTVHQLQQILRDKKKLSTLFKREILPVLPEADHPQTLKDLIRLLSIVRVNKL